MRRPALSAQRAVQIIDMLASDPRRGYAMSEIIRGTGINIGSCHALLSVLTDSGYLNRCPRQKTYTLGPALAAAGQCAMTSQPLLNSAQKVATELSQDLNVPVLLTTVVKDEIVAVLSIANEAGQRPGLDVGQRVPLAPPLGAVFVAWSGDEVIEQWLAKKPDLDGDELKKWQAAIALVRARGCQIVLKAKDEALSTIMSDIVSHALPGESVEWREFFESFDTPLLQPDDIVDDELYDVASITVPLFDENRTVVFGMALTGFREKVTGAALNDLVRALLRACMQIMRERP